MTDPKPARSPASRLGIAIAGLAVIIAVAGIYVMQGGSGNGGADGQCQAAADIAKNVKPLITGEVAALVNYDPKLPVGDLTFNDGDGKALHLKDFAGRVVLLNLWATWCAPCREEMPALDRLQKALGGPEFEVVTVNIDTRNPDRPKAFLKDIKVANLAYYADPTMNIFTTLKRNGRAIGMPTTMLVDRSSCEIATMNGPAEWDSEDAMKLIKAAIKAKG